MKGTPELRGSPHPRGYVHQSLHYINSSSVIFTNSWHIPCPHSPLRIFAFQLLFLVAYSLRYQYYTRA